MRRKAQGIEKEDSTEGCLNAESVSKHFTSCALLQLLVPCGKLRRKCVQENHSVLKEVTGISMRRYVTTADKFR